jgi:hypothetical protein
MTAPPLQALVMEEILRTVVPLAHDQYGNYVIQHVLEKGTPAEKAQLAASVLPQVRAMSTHKYASNVGAAHPMLGRYLLMSHRSLWPPARAVRTPGMSTCSPAHRPLLLPLCPCRWWRSA